MHSVCLDTVLVVSPPSRHWAHCAPTGHTVLPLGVTVLVLGTEHSQKDIYSVIN